MEGIESTAQRILRILTEDEIARDDDDYLIVQVYREILRERNINASYLPWHVLITYRREYELPSFETIRRARQHIQRKNPELAGSERVKEARAAKEEDVLEYVRS